MLGKRSIGRAIASTVQFVAKGPSSGFSASGFPVNSAGGSRWIGAVKNCRTPPVHLSSHRSASSTDMIVLGRVRHNQGEVLPATLRPRFQTNISAQSKQMKSSSISFQSCTAKKGKCLPGQAVIIRKLTSSCQTQSSISAFCQIRFRQPLLLPRRALSSTSDGKKGTDLASTPPAKLSRAAWLKQKWEGVKHEAHHYWVGTKLLGTEIMICVRILRQACAPLGSRHPHLPAARDGAAAAPPRRAAGFRRVRKCGGAAALRRHVRIRP